MSESVPSFKIGDRVRIMQTRYAERFGYANMIGEVVALQTATENLQASAKVLIGNLNGGKIASVPLSSLMPSPLSIGGDRS